MQISPNYHLNTELLNYLKKGKTLVLNETGNLRRATKFESFVRWFNWNKAKKQNKNVDEWLITHLKQFPNPTKEYSNSVEAISRYVKVIKRTDATFKRLENTVYTHKCILKLPTLKKEDLINEDGETTNELLPFLKKNLLHNVIFKANFKTRHTALLVDDKDVYIRAKNGKNFLENPYHIDLILSKLPKYHRDVPFLRNLRQLMLDTTNDHSKKMQKIFSELETSHYFYTNLKEIAKNKKGVLVGQAYMADGIENFLKTKWTELKPNFREKTVSNTYKLRIVTHLPKYALKNSWYEKIYKVVQNIFNFGAHGHSWIELCEPIENKKKNFSLTQNVYNIGYYMGFFIDLLNRNQRLESADHQAYIPFPTNQIVIEEVNITKEQFEKAKLYLTEVQFLLNRKKRRLDDKPTNPNLTKKQVEDIQNLYQSTIKSTCLGFANTLEELVTGIEKDNRELVRRYILPKKAFKLLDDLDIFFEKTFFLKWIVSLPRFFARMELPYFVKYQFSQKIRKLKPQLDTSV